MAAPDRGTAQWWQPQGHGWGGDTAASARCRRPGCRSGGLPVPDAEPGLFGTGRRRRPARGARTRRAARALCRQPGPPPRSPGPPAGRGRDRASRRGGRACGMLKGRRAAPGHGAVGGRAAGTASPRGPAPPGLAGL